MGRRTRMALFVGLMCVVLSGCWSQFRSDPSHTGLNPLETTISPSNVSTLAESWSAAAGGRSSPVVANGIAYVGAGSQLSAFDAAGLSNCSGIPTTCTPLWTAATGAIFSSPAVIGGVVYVHTNGKAFGSRGELFAFDAAGVTNCSGTPTTCTPLWTADTGDLSALSSPTVANGVVYVSGSDLPSIEHKNVYAFDAAGVTNCSGTPTICTPLWTATLVGTQTFSSPAVADGVLYVGDTGKNLYAFDAGGVTNCSGTPTTCAPLWNGTTGGAISSSPAVANGVVYVGSDDHNLYAFDAGGSTNCSGTPTTCAPLWSATTGDGISSSPAVANGVVYVGSLDHNLYAFDAGGNTNCSGTPTTCAPLWSATTGDRISSSPAVANGAVYVGSLDHNLYAFDAGGNTNCSGTPTTCAPLLAVDTGGVVSSSPAVANGAVYVGSGDVGTGDARLHAYQPVLPPLLDTMVDNQVNLCGATPLGGTTTGNQKSAASFSVNHRAQVSSVELPLSVVGSPPATIQVTIVASTPVRGDPTWLAQGFWGWIPDETAELARTTATVTAASAPCGQPEIVTATFEKAVEVLPGTTYWIVAQNPAGGSRSFQWNVSTSLTVSSTHAVFIVGTNVPRWFSYTPKTVAPNAMRVIAANHGT